ncbi:hypothetical protein ATL39_2166 [Sinobaca qinghaiensis]|uniref:Uncharacterized protein n=1 Tax=Sinobaca qinghaiensis TaxID=342944 RepID=A0A419V370_9BACL|nr:hypothetical protein [Sinobaca qinghaiensis]RKD72969.1 hypothetical protein ATL39_2166 [Sinobaca qinghaiensis]
MMPILMISFLSGLPLSLLNVFFHPSIYFIIIPVIYWCFHKQLGFRLLFIMAFSIYVNILISSIYPFGTPVLLDQQFSGMPIAFQSAIVFWGFLIPEISDRRYTIFAAVIIALAGFLAFLDPSYTIADIFYAGLIGFFLIFTLYRSLDWIGGAPDFLLLGVAVLLGICLFLLEPQAAFYAGLLLGFSAGFDIETIKNRMAYPSSFVPKIKASLVGLAGALLLLLVFEFAVSSAAVFLSGIILGLWITLFAPVLFIKMAFSKREGGILSSRKS